MFKNMIAPVQAWLLSQGRCVGCGMPLQKSKIKIQNSKMNEEKITCKCGRVYVQEKNGKFRRAAMSEV